MLGAADIDAWTDELRDEMVADLCRAGWHDADPATRLPSRQARLLARFHDDQPLTLHELADLKTALKAG
ncbi:hypothetical protein EYW49_10870 [Siculibacillus lacustris]|uniref:Uncharacterized protein n=1 Tax=Siculibacillus lacustris TaxID=1549641 RepID=A0A4V2KTK6_9HYPH|nr:hypothetical protein [Siculibacillus lacustris]TBW37604.1 hypothetical protein EYW49_10870 [Siculibacillus lacustris]